MCLSAMSVAANEFSRPQGYESGTPLGVPTRSPGGKLLEVAVSAEKICSVDGCLKTIWARKMCVNHYALWRRHGDPTLGRRVLPPEERFWQRVCKGTPYECWEWTGKKNRDGYGSFSLRSRSLFAHRVAFELVIGQIPPGLELDHLCRNRGCVNPLHLEPVTRQENCRRATAVRVVCGRGHKIVKINGIGRCRECIRTSGRAFARKKRDADRARFASQLDEAGLTPPANVQGSFANVWLRACLAALNGLENTNPYPDQRRADGGNTYRKSYRTAYDKGFSAGVARKIEKHLSAGNVREAAEASSLPVDTAETPGGYVGTFGTSNAPASATQKDVANA